MDRIIVYTDEQTIDTDFLNSEKNTMIGLGLLIQAILGTSTIVDGLACTPTGPASLQVQIGQGAIYSNVNVDPSAYGAIAADTTHQIMKQGIQLGTKLLTLTAPVTSGQSVNYLIEAQYEDVDTGSTVLPYYNASNPAVAYNGPANSGTSQNTVRQGQCVIQVKAGVAATSGSQVTPAPDAGFVGLWVVTVANGTTAITSGNIALYPGAPFIPYKLPNLPIRTVLTQNISLYVSTTGSDTTGNGSATAPWATVQKASNYIQSTLDLNGFTATVNVAAGSYSAGVAVMGAYVGATGPGSVVFLGNTGSPSSCLVAISTGYAFHAQSGAQFTVKGFQISGGFGCIQSDNTGSIIAHSNNNFGSVANAHIGVSGGNASAIGPYSIIAGAQEHLFSNGSGSIVAVENVTVTVTGTPAFSSAFAQATNLGYVLADSITFVGSATGSRYIANYNGVIQTLGAPTTYFPGNAAGSTPNGGLYA